MLAYAENRSVVENRKPDRGWSGFIIYTKFIEVFALIKNFFIFLTSIA